MMYRWSVASAAVLLVATGAVDASAQVTDSTPAVRHILALDYSRIRPMHRSYDIVVMTRDSVIATGQRDVRLEAAMLPDSTPGWLMVESRTGLVPSIDSVVLAADLRPVRWNSSLGAARLALSFSADSMEGTVRLGHASTAIGAAVPPDLVVSTEVTELLVSLLPLAPEWSDSVSVLALSFAGASVEAAEMRLVGEDTASAGAGPARPCWVITLRSGSRESRFWFDRENRVVVREEHPLPAHVGTTMQYRLRPEQP